MEIIWGHVEVKWGIGILGLSAWGLGSRARHRRTLRHIGTQLHTFASRSRRCPVQHETYTIRAFFYQPFPKQYKDPKKMAEVGDSAPLFL